MNVEIEEEMAALEIIVVLERHFKDFCRAGKGRAHQKENYHPQSYNFLSE
jgi:hypothetical protein